MTTAPGQAPDHLPDRQPVAKIGSPGELALVIPELLGYWPSESLTVIALGEPRGRMGLIQRLDLPPPGMVMPPAVADAMLARVAQDDGTRAVVVVWTEAADREADLPGADIVEALAAAALRADLEITEAVLVRAGRWWSYLCSRACCPRVGTPLTDAEDADSVSLVAVERALSGRAVFGSRADLAASIAPVLPAGESAQVELLESAAIRLVTGAWAERAGWRLAMLERYRRAIAGLADPRYELTDTDLGDLVVALGDLPLRDCVLVEALVDPTGVQRMLELLCRHALPPFDAPVCALLAWVCHVRGDGTLAGIAAERALDDDPLYSAAHLVLDALEAAVDPAVMRASIERARADTYRVAGLDDDGRRLRGEASSAAAGVRRSRSRAR